MKKRILVTAIIMATTTIVLPIYGNATGPIVPITLGTDAISLKQVPEANDKIIITDTDNKFGSEPSKIKVTFTVINTVPAKTSDGTDISFLDAKKIAVTLPPEIYGYCNIDIFVNENKVYTGVIQLKQAPTTKTPEKIAAGWMLLRPLSLTTDLYNSNQITQTTDSTVFTKSSQPQGGYNASISYNLRLSTLDYIFTPHPTTPNWFSNCSTLYIQGTYGDSVSLPDSSVTIKYNKSFSYRYGVKFSATFDDLSPSTKPAGGF